MNTNAGSEKKRTLEECEAIIDEMTDRLVFALNFWTYKGEFVSGVNKTPIRWFAEVLEKVGVRFDPKDLDALHWPAKERRKYFNDKAKQKKAQP